MASSDNVYAAFTTLAVKTGAVNLGQGFPDDPAPGALLERAISAIADGHNQYPPTRGVRLLLDAISEHQRRQYGVALDPETEIIVTTGASEAITATLMAVIGPGDEVLVVEPCYDLYPAAVELAGGRVVRAASVDAFTDLVGPRTRAVILNSPGNPSGQMLSREDLREVGELAERYNLTVISDEVYEHIVMSTTPHISAHQEPRLRERCVVVSSAAKTFCVTGWKVGWASGPAHLIDQVHRVKQYLSFASGTPFQHAVAVELGEPDAHVRGLCDAYRKRCDLLTSALERSGYTLSRPAGGYFVMADAAPLGVSDTATLWAHCSRLPNTVGIVGIPGAVFSQGEVTTIRFCFAKSQERIEEACARLDRAGRRTV